jgi:hypothetical protein
VISNRNRSAARRCAIDSGFAFACALACGFVVVVVVVVRFTGAFERVFTGIPMFLKRFAASIASVRNFSMAL